MVRNAGHETRDANELMRKTSRGLPYHVSILCGVTHRTSCFKDSRRVSRLVSRVLLMRWIGRPATTIAKKSKSAIFDFLFRVSRLVSRVSNLFPVSCLGLVLLSSCSSPAPPQHVEFLAMGTVVSIDVVGMDAREARVAMTAAQNDIQYLGREWYPWANNGELVRLNAALAKGQAAPASPALVKLLRYSANAFRLSDGLFDPAVAPLVELWGFQDGERDPRQAPPAEARLNAWQSNHPTLADLVIGADSVHSARIDLKLDLGAVAKGYVVDLAIERLRQHGATNALVNAGGNLRAIGHPDESSPGRGWRVAIRSPRATEPLAWLELQGEEGVSTSGDYERFAIIAGQRIHHLLDPRTGRPATHTVAVTVVAVDATIADAAATAIFVAGPERWRDIARTLGIRQALRVDATGIVEVSRELAAKLHLSSSEPRQIPWRQVDL